MKLLIIFFSLQLFVVTDATATPKAIQYSKKQQYQAKKQTSSLFKKHSGHHPPSQAIEPIFVKNLHTLEIMPFEGIPITSSSMNRFLRCWFTHEQKPLPPVLIHTVVATAKHFGVRYVEIISGYRHPKFNLMLRKKGHEVALKSQHTRAYAIDFSLPTIDTDALYRFLLRTHQGGVGYYPVNNFVHIDLGRKRTWNGE